MCQKLYNLSDFNNTCQISIYPVKFPYNLSEFHITCQISILPVKLLNCCLRAFLILQKNLAKVERQPCKVIDVF